MWHFLFCFVVGNLDGAKPMQANFSGRRTFVGGARVVSSTCVVNGAEKKKHLIKAALLGHLDQMLSTIV